MNKTTETHQTHHTPLENMRKSGGIGGRFRHRKCSVAAPKSLSTRRHLTLAVTKKETIFSTAVFVRYRGRLANDRLVNIR